MGWKKKQKKQVEAQRERDRYTKSVEEQRDRLWDENEQLKQDNDNLKMFTLNLVDGLLMIEELAAALRTGQVAVAVENKDGRNKFVAVELPEVTDDKKEDDGQRDRN